MMPGWPKNPRMQLCRVLLQEGVYLDYLTGEFEPSLSEGIRGVVRDARAKGNKARGVKVTEGNHGNDSDKNNNKDNNDNKDLDLDAEELDPELTSKILALIGPKHIKLFPQFLIDESFPPTYIVHGELDSGVRVGESRNLVRLLERNGNGGTLKVVRGEEHSFDYASGAYEKYGEMFDEVFEFVDGVLK
ncbi:alpha beta-hydrolase [Pyrrhoderma noxium]|uniref:Alpha beta-hydrolase n=1 Tax=Pyrrhoderma noxium TaxID=2282107 RepID=A0A286UCB9_9AGAM|nr:alpha beta-hydrolase [Pyrrhoderma noxium]